MAYQLTSAVGCNDLLNKLGLFAASIGWTVEWNAGGQLGLTYGNLHAAIGKRVSTPDIPRQMLISGGTPNDTPIVGTLASAFSVTQTYFGGHTGAPGGSNQTSSSHVWTNDWYGPFSEVHFISGPNNSYIHVIARTPWVSPRVDDRWSMLSLGLLDVVGATIPACPYLTGAWFEWWENSSNPAAYNYSPNKLDRSWSSLAATFTSNSDGTGHAHSFGITGGSNFLADNVHLRMISGVLDTSLFLGIPDVAYSQLANVRIFNNNAGIRSSNSVNFSNDIINFATPIISSIGNTMVPMDAFYGTSYLTPFCHLGQFPGVRMIRMTNLEPGDQFSVNLETWIVFPIKKKGSESDSGVSAGVNTWNYGYAFLKG